MREQQDALKNLKEDNSIVVLPADKGRASVVLDADTYHGNMAALSESGPNQLLNKDPALPDSETIRETAHSVAKWTHITSCL